MESVSISPSFHHITFLSHHPSQFWIAFGKNLLLLNCVCLSLSLKIEPFSNSVSLHHYCGSSIHRVLTSRIIFPLRPTSFFSSSLFTACFSSIFNLGKSFFLSSSSLSPSLSLSSLSLSLSLEDFPHLLLLFLDVTFSCKIFGSLVEFFGQSQVFPASG